MPMIPVSPVDAISPAIEWTRRLLLRPFRWGVWIRFAVLAVVTGQVSGGFNFPMTIPRFPRAHPRGGDSFLPAGFPLHRGMAFAAAIALAIVAIAIFVLVFMYLASVLRLVLMESVVTGRVHLREGFRRWRPLGTRFFLFNLVLAIALYLALGVPIGLPILIAWRAGVFRDPVAHLPLLIAGGLCLGMLFLLIVLAFTVFFVFSKDLVVPIMALENVGPVEGWRRLMPMLRSAQGTYAGYIGMKIVLALAAAIMSGIATFIVDLILIIPIAVVAVIAFVVAHAAGIGWNVFTIAMAIVAGVMVIALLSAVAGMIGAPVAVFFQCYALRFFAGRYQRLSDWLYPPPPPVVPVPSPA